MITQSTQLYQGGKICPFSVLLLRTFSLHLFQEADQEQDRGVKDCCMHLDLSFNSVMRQYFRNIRCMGKQGAEEKGQSMMSLFLFLPVNIHFLFFLYTNTETKESRMASIKCHW